MTSHSARLAAVLWSGSLGGAETFTVELCRVLRALGADARVLFVTSPEPLNARLEASAVPFATLGLRRGREVVRHPRALAHATTSLGPDGAIVVSPGYLAAALRAGGYRGRVVAMAHDLIQLSSMSRTRMLLKRVDRASGAWASDVEVAVSDFVLRRVQRHARPGKRVVRIYNGVDLDVYSGAVNGSTTQTLDIGWAGRIVHGKGLETLIEALPTVRRHVPVRLRIAGDGPLRSTLEEHAGEIGLGQTVAFEGWSTDMPSFWGSCALAAITSNTLTESFGMAAVEAMACARPVVASRSGALPEIVEDGVTGRLVPPGDHEALAEALIELAQDADHRTDAGAAGRARCEDRFDLRRTALAYLDLFRD
jgi:glycosyltransferase involved in cell wall biosynthesis